MSSVSRDELHRVVEQLPDNRLTAAAELLEVLNLRDQRVSTWRQNLSSFEESEIAASLRREYTADDWVTDESIAAWIASDEDRDAAR